MHALSPHEETEPATSPGSLGQELLTIAEPAKHLIVGRVVDTMHPGIEVCHGVQTALGRTVRVQRPAAGTSPAIAERLRREAARLAQLDHPNILPIYDVIEDSGTIAVVTPDVPGRRWDERLSQPHRVRTDFDVEDVLTWHTRVLLQVCNAVQFAHERGIVHRDLRPENIWIGDVGEVYLSRWALAAPERDCVPLTTEELAELGNASFIAPEMVMRSAGHVGPHTDVYQLGGLLYLILTGEPPHSSESIDDAVRHVLFRDPPLPDDAPAALSRVCKRALNRNPRARQPNVAAFRKDLEQALSQRSAWTTAARADQQFDVLRRLLHQPHPDRGQVFQTYGALRLGYRRALQQAPGLPGAKLRLGRATELVVAHLHQQGDEDAGAAILAESEGRLVEAPPTPRQAQPEPGPTYGTDRMLLCVVLWWTPLLLAAIALTGPGSMWVAPACCVAAGSGAAVLNRMGAYEAGRPQHPWLAWAPLVLGVCLATAALLGATALTMGGIAVIGAALVASAIGLGPRRSP
ncbi:MAG: serine/threonine-protein kinase [Myxococcota bacterium]